MTLASLAALAFSVLALLASPHGTLGTSWLRAYRGFSVYKASSLNYAAFLGVMRVVLKNQGPFWGVLLCQGCRIF